MGLKLLQKLHSPDAEGGLNPPLHPTLRFDTETTYLVTYFAALALAACMFVINN